MRRSLDAISVLSSDDLAEYDVISESSGFRSLESSIDLGYITPSEPAPSQAAQDLFRTPGLTQEDIQAYVQRALGPNTPSASTLVRVYVDGTFDSLSARCALRLRQAKLSFPHVHLIVGVFSDEQYAKYNPLPPSAPHLERCELVRHCRWVDEVLPSAPWRLDATFLREKKIDFVAIDVGASVDPAVGKERVKGYDFIKTLGKSIPVRKTPGLARPTLKTVTTSDAGVTASEPENGTLRGPRVKAKDTVRFSATLEREKQNGECHAEDDGPVEKEEGCVEEVVGTPRVGEDLFGEPRLDLFGM